MGNCHVQTCIFGLDVRIVGSRWSCRNPDLKISHWTNHYPVTDFVGRKKDAGDNKEKNCDRRISDSCIFADGLCAVNRGCAGSTDIGTYKRICEKG